jgi:hypothetical protein
MLHHISLGYSVFLNPTEFILRGLPRIRHTGESRYPENPTGFRVKHGMTFDTPLLAAG